MSHFNRGGSGNRKECRIGTTETRISCALPLLPIAKSLQPKSKRWPSRPLPRQKTSKTGSRAFNPPTSGGITEIGCRNKKHCQKHRRSVRRRDRCEYAGGGNIAGFPGNRRGHRERRSGSRGNGQRQRSRSHERRRTLHRGGIVAPNHRPLPHLARFRSAAQTSVYCGGCANPSRLTTRAPSRTTSK